MEEAETVDITVDNPTNPFYEVSLAELAVKHELLEYSLDAVELSDTEVNEIPVDCDVDDKSGILNSLDNGAKNKITKQNKARKAKKNIKYVSVVEEKVIRCTKCAAKFHSKTGFLNHLRMHDRPTVFQCALCKQQFDTNKALVAHKESHENDTLTFVCEICRLAFDNYLDWTLHQLVHKVRVYYKCEECQKYFKLKYLYEKHVETHYNRKLKCDVCSATLKTSSQLKSHKALHDRSSQCKECGRICTNSSYLKYHMISHTGVKPFQCLYCGKGFSNSLQRKVHTRVHTNERPYKCSSCSAAFKQLTDLNKHSCKGIKQEKPYDCDVCRRKFKLRASLASHMLLHSDYRPFPCDKCEAKFVSFTSLKMHTIYKHTTERPYKCKKCDKDFKLRACFNRHQLVHKRREKKIAVKTA